MKKMKKFLTIKLAFTLTAVLFFSCQQDDNFSVVEVQETTNVSASVTDWVTPSQIPDILSFITPKVNKDGYFEISRKNTGMRTNEPDLIFGELQTSEIVRVTDQYDRSNYSFLLSSIESNDVTVKSIFNLIVKESTGDLISYIMEYRPDESWIPDYSDRNFMSTFTGDILFYTIDGVYIARSTSSNGISTNAETRNSCPDDGDNNNNGNGGGEGQDGGDGPANSDGDSGDSGDGGQGITVEITTVTCGCDPAHEGGNESDDCVCQADDTTVINIKSSFDSKLNELSRNPCPNTEEVCYQENTDPCPCDVDGVSCIPETNPDTGVVTVDLECTIENNAINDNSPFEVELIYINPCTSDEETTPEDETLLCVYKKLTQSPLFQDMLIDTFGESLDLHVTFTVRDILDTNNSDAKGVTKPTRLVRDGETVGLDIEIQIKRSYLQSGSGVGAALVVAHEALHAYLVALRYVADQTAQIGDIEVNSLAETLQELYNSGNEVASQTQHAFMFDNFVPVLSQILSDVRDGLILPEHQEFVQDGYTFIDEDNPTGEQVPWNWDLFHYYMALTGLQNSQAFQEEIPMDSPEFQNFSSYTNTGLNLIPNPCKD